MSLPTRASKCPECKAAWAKDELRNVKIGTNLTRQRMSVVCKNGHRFQCSGYTTAINEPRVYTGLRPWQSR